jgi:hypothetical protein
VASLRSYRDEDSNDGVRAQAALVAARWRRGGFDIVLCHPSGYCSPANSAAMRMDIPAGYVVFAIDSEAAVDALASSIAKGVTYRV